MTPDEAAELERPASDPFDPFRPQDTQAEKKKKKRRGSFLTELPVLVVIALVVAVVIKTFLVQAFWIPSGSMIPTLEVNDRVMVNKLTFRFTEPERGDVVVFDSPFAPPELDRPLLDVIVETITQSLGIRTAALADDLIKRVIAVGGDTVEIKDNEVLVNGVAIDEPYLAPGAVMADYEPKTLEPGELFVMGDNRDNSSDSRKFGPIPVDAVTGRAFVRFWPTDRWGRL